MVSAIKTFLNTSARWGWFLLLVLTAFGYLASGLSEPEAETRRASNEGDIAETVTQVNHLREEILQNEALQSAPIADWMTICRRLSLALVGNQMSLEEIRELEQLPESEREAAHLANLLKDTRYHYYWAERWTRFLVGTDEGDLLTFRRRRFRVWLADVFAENRRYDDVVRDLITAEGLWTDKPEVNFLTATFDSNEGEPDPIRLAARTSRAFLGLRIDCLQCHSDFLGNVSLGDVDKPREGLQSDFHQLAAFFSSAKTSGLQGVRTEQVDYQYKYLDAEEEVAVEPMVPYSPELLPLTGNPRWRLAEWITHPENKQAARAAVSHIWALMFGRPLGEAVDNLPLDEQVSPIVAELADDFVDNEFDIHRLIRLITASDSFRVDSRADFEITSAHEQFGAVFPLVRLRPEQVAGSVIQAGRIKRTDRESSFTLQLLTLVLNSEFVKQYGDVGEDEFTTDAVTVTQRLLMMNGQMTREMTELNPILNASAHIGMFSEDDSQSVENFYLCTLNRYPTEAERDHFVGRLSAAEKGDRMLEDIAWVLMNSSELAWNH